MAPNKAIFFSLVLWVGQTAHHIQTTAKSLNTRLLLLFTSFRYLSSANWEAVPPMLLFARRKARRRKEVNVLPFCFACMFVRQYNEHDFLASFRSYYLAKPLRDAIRCFSYGLMECYWAVSSPLPLSVSFCFFIFFWPVMSLVFIELFFLRNSRWHTDEVSCWINKLSKKQREYISARKAA